MEKQQIGKLVRERRMERNISYREFAKLTGLTTRSIQQVENAVTNYGVDTLAVICKALDLEVRVE